MAELLAGVRAELPPHGRIFFGSFPSEVRPEHVTPEAMRLLRRYVANDNIIIGAQSGSDAVLAAAGRGHGTGPVRDAVRIAVSHGFRPNVDFIFGMPGEGADDQRASLALADELTGLGARIHAHTFMPLPGTPWRDAEPGVHPAVDDAGAGPAGAAGKLLRALAQASRAFGTPGRDGESLPAPRPQTPHHGSLNV